MKQNSKKWEPKVIGTDDRELLYQSREQFFGSRDEAYVDHLYFNNPAGELFGYFAMDGDTIAGQYIIIPIDLSIEGQRIKATMSLDTFTNPDYRRQGIFTGLAEKVYAHAAQQGVAFTMGLPNENSRPGFLSKLAFEEPFSIVQSMRPLALRASSGTAARSILARLPFGMVEAIARHTTRLEFTTTDSPSPQWLQELWMRYENTRHIELMKDARWVTWRYMDNPKFQYRFLTATKDGEPLGYLVWNTETQHTRNRRSLTLMDIVAVNPATYIRLMQTFLNEIAGETDVVKAMYSPFSVYGSTLMAFGFIPYKKNSFIVRSHNSDVDLKKYFRQGKWSVSSCYADFL